MLTIFDFLFQLDSIYDFIFWLFFALSLVGGVWFWWAETRPEPKDQFLQDPVQGGTR